MKKFSKEDCYKELVYQMIANYILHEWDCALVDDKPCDCGREDEANLVREQIIKIEGGDFSDFSLDK